jgi:hypothetical protein
MVSLRRLRQYASRETRSGLSTWDEQFAAANGFPHTIQHSGKKEEL